MFTGMVFEVWIVSVPVIWLRNTVASAPGP
jgi:hypothetical protein